MPNAPIPESPSARVLLELAASSADAQVAVGDRAVWLRAGAIAEVTAQPDDLSFGDFLVRAERLEARDLEAVRGCAEERGISLEQALRELDAVSEETLHATRRALLLDRLTRAFAREDESAEATPEVQPLSQLAAAPAYGAPELVWDALARRAAAHGEAELIGSLPTARFVFLEGAEQRRAADWAEFGDIPIAVSLATLFARHPAAPARIAALLRTGVAKLDIAAREREVLKSSRAPVRESVRPELSCVVLDAPPPEAPTPEAPFAVPEVVRSRGPLDIAPVPNWLERSEATLADPLREDEARAHELEAANAEGAERAAAWLKLADGWLTHQHSYLEAARAAREAAAADPSNVEALAGAATYTATAGAPDVALAYALAWAEQCEAPEDEARALSRAAEYAERAGVQERVLAARREAVDLCPKDASLEERLARALASADDVQSAIEHARKAAELLRDEQPERARALLEWAARLGPSNPRTWTDLAKLLARSSYASAAVATLAQASRSQKDSAVRERLRTAAVTFAEAASRPDLAAEVLLDALDAFAVDRERLVANLYAAADWTTLSVVASELAAASTGVERANFLIHAAEANAALAHGERAIALLAEAVVSDPEHAEALDRLTAMAVDRGDPYAVRDALERAARLRCPDRSALASLIPAARAELIAVLERLGLELARPEDAAHARDVAQLLHELDGRPIDPDLARRYEEHIALSAAEIQRCEQAVRNAPPHARTAPMLALGVLCRVDPARRTTAIKLYRKVLEREALQAEALRELEALLRLDGDYAGLRALYEALSAEQSDSGPLLSLAYLELSLGDSERALETASRAMAADARDVHANTLCYRLASARRELPRAQNALRLLAAAHEPGPLRARVLMRLARSEEAGEQRELAARSALAALAADPDSADAALAVLSAAEQVQAKDRAQALSRARGALGDSAELMRELARAAYIAHDPRTQREALDALLRITPDDPFPARALVAMHSTGQDREALSEALDAALARERFTPDSLYVVQRGLARLSELGDGQRAAAMVVASLPVLGERAQPLLAWAEATALAASAHELACALLEQRIALSDRSEQIERLRELAARLRARGVHWAEARAYLRLLALAPDDVDAASGLLRAYARTNEGERLRATLEAQLKAARSEEVEQQRRFELALVAHYFEGDAERAAELIAEAVAPRREGRELHEVPVETLRRGIGILRAALPERAFALLRSLAEQSSLARGRELLEEAIALAEGDLEEPALALEAAVQGALSHPDHPPLVEALGRLARKLSRIETWVDTLEGAAERSANPARQAELLREAAELAERELGDGARACLLLDRAYRATPTEAVEELALSAAKTLLNRDLRAGKLAYDRLRDTLHVRAKFGAPLERARSLITLSRLAEEVYLARDEALRYAEAAGGALASSDESPLEERKVVAEVVKQRLSQLTNGEPTRVRERGASSIRKSFVESDSPMRGVELSPTLRPGGSLPAQSARPVRSMVPLLDAAAPLASLPSVDIRGSHRALSVAPESAPQEETSSIHELDSGRNHAVDSVDALLGAVASGHGTALAVLAQRLQSDPSSAEWLCAALLAQVRGRPLNAVALRALRLAGAAAGEHALWRTTSQALAFLEPALKPPSPTRRRELPGGAREPALRAARESHNYPAFELLSTLVEGAAPLFRRNLASILRTKNQPEPLREAPYGPLLAELAEFLGFRFDAYLYPSGEDRVLLLSAQPAVVLVGDRTPRESASLRYRLARAAECTRAEHVLIATLSAFEADALFAAVKAAFGPAQGQRATVSREAAALASDLWRTMPNGAQKKLARMLAELPGELSFAALQADLRLRSARVALCAARELDVALAQLGRDLDEGTPHERTETALNRALANDPLTRELVGYALSEPYLNAVREADS